MQHCDVEEFWVVALNSQCQLLDARMLFRGTVDQCLFHPRDLFRYGLLKNASSLVVAHNHPTGQCFPSPEDKQITKKMIAAGKLLDIPVLDHIIFSKNNNKRFYQKMLLFLIKKIASAASTNRVIFQLSTDNYHPI